MMPPLTQSAGMGSCAYELYSWSGHVISAVEGGVSLDIVVISSSPPVEVV